MAHVGPDCGPVAVHGLRWLPGSSQASDDEEIGRFLVKTDGTATCLDELVTCKYLASFENVLLRNRGWLLPPNKRFSQAYCTLSGPGCEAPPWASLGLITKSVT